MHFLSHLLRSPPSPSCRWICQLTGCSSCLVKYYPTTFPYFRYWTKFIFMFRNCCNVLFVHGQHVFIHVHATTCCKNMLPICFTFFLFCSPYVCFAFRSVLICFMGTDVIKYCSLLRKWAGTAHFLDATKIYMQLPYVSFLYVVLN